MSVNLIRAAVAALALSVAARAGAVEVVLAPSTPLTADGLRVHTLRLYLTDGDALAAGVPQVRATHGAVVGAATAVSDGGIAVRYRPPRVTASGSDTLLVTLPRATLSVPVPLEPAGRVQLALTVAPDPLLLGRGATALVKLKVRDAAGRPARAPLRIGASVGKLSSLEELGPGEYQATYSAPDDKFPQVAILAAISVADGAFAAVPLKLAARVTVPGEGEPGGSMSITVDGKTFGPQPIDEQGRFAIPIVVPPGGRAVGTSTDKLGNSERREIDLKLPPFPRLVLAAIPSQLPADGRSRAEVVAFAVDGRGAPERSKAPQLATDRGTLSQPQPHGDGAFSWTYTAPAQLADGKVAITAGGAGTRLTLRPAPPYRIAYGEPKEPVGAGSDAPQAIEVRVEDAAGSPVEGARLTATLAGGRVIGAEELGGGRYAIKVIAPRDPGRGAATLHVELGGLQPGAPRRVSLHPARAPAGRIAVEAWVDDDLGLPVPDAPVELTCPDGPHLVVSDRYGVARVELERPAERRFRVGAQLAALPGLEAGLDFLQLGATVRTVPSLQGRGVTPSEDAPPGASLDVDVALRPAAPVDLRVSLDPPEVHAGQPTHVRIRLTDAAGKPYDGAIVYQASAGRVDLLAPVRDGTAELRFTPPPSAAPGTRFLISVTETKTRVTVFTEVTTR
jgi:hypothetical protein